MKKTIADKIIALRKSGSLSQQDLADGVYVSRSLVAMWEAGKRMPDGVSVKKIAKFFNVAESDIVEDRRYVFGAPSELELMEIEIGEFTDDSQNSDEDVDVAVRAFLGNLNKRDKAIFMGRYYSMKTCKTIAAEMKMKESTVRWRLSVLRKELKTVIGGDTDDTQSV